MITKSEGTNVRSIPQKHLAKLLQREEIVADAAAATSELKAALVKLRQGADERQLEALEAKSRLGRLDRQELTEFQNLM